MVLSFFKARIHRYTKKNKMARGLTDLDELEEKMSEQNKKISIDLISERILDLHENIKECLDEEIAKPVGELLSFSDIMKICVGENYSILINFYKDINFLLREITKERIKNTLKPNFCSLIVFQCIYFFKTIDMFMKKDYNLANALEMNEDVMKRTIDGENLYYLIKKTKI